MRYMWLSFGNVAVASVFVVCPVTTNPLTFMREFIILFCKPKSAYDMRMSERSSDVCSTDLLADADWVVDAMFGTGLARVLADAAAHSHQPESCVEIGRASCRERVCQYV